MKFTASQIAIILKGEVEGNRDVEVHKLSKIEEGEDGSLTFLSNPKYTPHIYSTKASIVIVDNNFVSEKTINTTLIRVEDAYNAFSKLLEFYNEVKINKLGIEAQTYVSKSASIGKNLYLGAFSYISDNVIIGNNVKIFPNVYVGDNVTIGENTIIYTGSIICSDTIIGKNCVFHPGVIIGSDGFGFAPNSEGSFSKIPQIGNVIIEDNVDIGAATTVDRATLGSTIIRQGVKLDNQIQVAHNVEIGQNTVIAAQSGIAGSSKIGENCMIGGQVGIAGHLVIGNNVRMQAKTGVGRNISDNEIIQGAPAFRYSDYNKSYVYFKKLPELAATIHALQKEINALKKNNE